MEKKKTITSAKHYGRSTTINKKTGGGVPKPRLRRRANAMRKYYMTIRGWGDALSKPRPPTACRRAKHKIAPLAFSLHWSEILGQTRNKQRTTHYAPVLDEIAILTKIYAQLNFCHC